MVDHHASLDAALARTRAAGEDAHTAEKDSHAGCLEAWEQQGRRAEFAEARLAALVVELRYLAQAMDGIQGHTPQPRLEGKTLGGAVRFVADGKPAPRVTPPGEGRA